MWLVIEEVDFESYYSGLDNPVGLYRTREIAEDAATARREEVGGFWTVIFVEVRG